jgi:ubiquinone/menaquinone biosynthesis C-methylase UbiE
VDLEKYKEHQCKVTAKQIGDMPLFEAGAEYLLPEKIPTFLVDRYQRNVTQIKEHLTESTRVLDIGCRTGIFLLYLTIGGVKDCWGIDIHDGSIEIAQGRGMNAVCGDMHNLPWDNEFFNIVTCTQVIEHAHSPDVVLSEIDRVLQPGGILWIDAPLEGPQRYSSKRFNKAGHHCFWTHPNEFMAFLKQNFEVIRPDFQLKPPDEKGRVWMQGIGFLCRKKGEVNGIHHGYEEEA